MENHAKDFSLRGCIGCFNDLALISGLEEYALTSSAGVFSLSFHGLMLFFSGGLFISKVHSMIHASLRSIEVKFQVWKSQSLCFAHSNQ